MFARINRAGFAPAEGGNVHVINSLSPGPVRHGQYGIGLGPLRVTAWRGSTAVVEDLSFTRAEESSWWPFALGVVGASTALDPEGRETTREGFGPEDTRLSRRSFIAAASLTVLGASAARAQSDGERYNVASFDLPTNQRGLQLAIDDVVADYLSPDHTFYVTVDGTRLGGFDASEGSKTINPGIEGTVEIESDEAVSFLDRMLQRVRADDGLEYEWKAVDTAFDQQTVGDELVLSSQPVLVEPLVEADPDDVLVEVDGETVPHVDGDASAVGSWYVRDDTALVYTVGENAPASELVSVRVGVGVLDKLRTRF